ncbi:MAG: AAA family ATPase [Oleiphilaceae bacterium]|nr:AAA family ATPase [Oleiphilaceae bacterium]
MSRELIQALQDPSRFDHEVRDIQWQETHISWVILTGSYAYKIKKPMDFGFLDFSTLERRKRFCEEEVRLNRRLAPDLYLGVLPITGSPEDPRLGGDEEPFEYAIQMRQFDQSGLLPALVERGELKEDHIDQLARQVAVFHQSIPAVDSDSPLGSVSGVEAPLLQNFEQIRPMISDPSRLKQLDRIAAWSESTLERLKPVIAQRHENGFVRECHGDLHLANITLHEGRVTVFDCIEFNDEFRFIDVFNDLSFLLMDLEDRGLTRYANRLLDRYLEHTGDFGALPLLQFYKAYRAMVRGKIALFTMGNEGLSEEQQQAHYRRYCQYADLAESYAGIPERFLILTRGYSGSGKSHAALHLSETLGAIRIRSDVERKRLFGLGPKDSSRAALDQGIYTPEATQRTYQHLAELARLILQAGQAVIVDSAALRQPERELLLSVAEEHGVPGMILDCDAPETVLRQRLQRRTAGGDSVSEADEKVLDKQLQVAEPLTEAEKSRALRIDTDQVNILEDLSKRIKAHFGHL